MIETPAREDVFVQLPSNLIFTKLGLDLFKKSPDHNVVRLRNLEGRDSEGFISPSFNATIIQKMVMNSYLEEIYVSLPDLLSKRYEIISTNNLIVYAILYKKLTPALATMLFNSKVVQAYNRKNPRNSMMDLKHISKSNTKKLIESKREMFNRLEQEILDEALRMVQTNHALTEEDKIIRAMSLPKFLGWIDQRIWYLYFIIYQTDFKDSLLRSFARMLTLYLDNTSIATHLSNLLMEFVQNAEKAHYERLITKLNLAPNMDPDRFLMNDKNRAFVAAEAIRKKQNLHLAWSMNMERGSLGQQYRIHITISNYGLIDEKIRSMLSTKMRTEVKGISLANFYDEGMAGGDKLGAGLGLLYNSYLEDICIKKGIVYKCNIYPEIAQEKTTVKIDITL